MIDSSIMWQNPAAYAEMQTHYDTELQKITFPYQTQYVDTRHGKTHVLTAGSPANPALVFWHGMNANITMWIDQINAFAPDFYVIAADGTGDTGRSAPNRLNRQTNQHGEWAADVLNALGIVKAHHVGISGGGWLILKLANVAPEKIASAVLASSGGLIRFGLSMYLKLLPRIITTPAHRRATVFVKIMTPPEHKPTTADLKMFELIFKFKSERGVPRLPDEQIRALTAPTMILMGQYEIPFTPQQKLIDRGRRVLPNLVRAEIMPGVGHGMNGDNPALFEHKLRDFFAQLN
ncbi:MAG: alpha/beta hydrolase [Anaerolineae bacterium]|nr:alpha/beta hydrolase [Anaerolineae bacterium]